MQHTFDVMEPTTLWLQAGLLAAEVITTAALFVVVFRVRGALGNVPLYIAVGAFQFTQTLLSLSVLVPFGETLHISPGTTVMLPATIFAVLLVYIADDAPEARRVIYGVVIANVGLAVLALLFGGHLTQGQVVTEPGLSSEIFWRQPRLLLFGTAAMFMDVVLVIVFYERISKFVRAPFGRLVLSTVAVLWLDTVVFVTGTAFGDPDLPVMLVSGLVGKSLAAVLYAGIFSIFILRPGLHLVPEGDDEEFRDFFHALTYRQRYEQAREMALRDPLTGLYNRRFFSDSMAREADHAVRYQTPLALLLIDIDHFKAVNDRFGHTEGDRALRLVSGAIARTVRGADIACRVGGEEFAVIAPRATEAIAELLAERIRAAITEEYRLADPPFGMDSLTVTIGIAGTAGSDDATVASLPDELFVTADRRLYLGKTTGRDRVVGWRQEEGPARLRAKEA